MFDETDDPQPTDPPTGTGGGDGTTPTNPEEAQLDRSTDPPTTTGGGTA